MAELENTQVASTFAAYQPDIRERLLELRELILTTAETTKGVGQIEETLKWGQPSYLTKRPKSGTTIRIDRDNSDKGDFALYVSCQTNLVDNWRQHYPELSFGGTRSIHFKLDEPLPSDVLSHCIAMALTYHLRKK
jgi:uncharacterized protein YdhG (YjbR/CyaY superfamily)